MGRVDFAFDAAIATEQATLGDVVPFTDEVRGKQNGLPALGLEAKRVLKPLAPLRVEAQARLIQQKSGRIRKQKQGKTKTLAQPSGKLTRQDPRFFAQSSQFEDGFGARERDAPQAGVELKDLQAGETRMKSRVLWKEERLRCARRRWRRISQPSIRADPVSGLTNPTRIFTVVVLPAPLGPISMVISRGCAVKERPRRTSFVR